jgi:SAM-dependent methyltransferase
VIVPEIVNVDQATAWDGEEGASWVEREERQNEALRSHTARLLRTASVGTAARVLDVGCGCGETTRACARQAVDGHALGVDLSTAMLERAGQRAAEEGLSNVSFERGDAQVYGFEPGHFDLVVSRFGVMFFADPVAAFTNIGRGVAAGGRLALLVWRELQGNEWLTAIRDALAVGRDLPAPPTGAPGPFGLADPRHVRSVLGDAGFDRVELEAVEEPFWFGPDANDAFEFARGIGLVRGLLADLDADDITRALEALRTMLDAHDSDDGVVFDSRAWIITAFR